MAELAGRRAGCARGDSPVPREEEHSWAQLLGSQPSPGHRSSSSSICTEDFAASFWEGMVEPLLCQEELAGDVPTEGAHPGQEESLLPAGRSPDVRPQLAMEPGRHSWQDRAPSRRRRESLESLGARISRLSHAGMAWGVPGPVPSGQPALGRRDSPHGDLSAMASPGHSWRTPGISAGRSRAGTRTGSPGSSFPRASSAMPRGHPALGMRRQEPPALWRRGGNVTFAVDDVDRAGAGSSSKSESGLAVGHWEVLEEGAGLGQAGEWAQQGQGHGGRDQPQFLWGFCGCWHSSGSPRAMGVTCVPRWGPESGAALQGHALEKG
ncbi:uncharacterized protein LOC121662071 [Corvus kubaryi]|uniref:uncharacterized protein LOC121662071 n=1 Tax=Corvus kubaryi TaxID=68294 RepID=UPI001C03C023|nr:uncharacterized protein LOC121662071 [Corvus kubaryi]